MHYVYILRSLYDGTFYKGYTLDYNTRLAAHNAGSSRYTSQKVPWELVYLEVFMSKKEALIREGNLKHANSEYILRLIESDRNRLGKI
jgi:putative endonuclease